MTDRVPLAAVLGHPISHSKSPRLHGHWLNRYQLSGHYIPIDVAPERVADAIASLRTLGFAGTNVTIPHKEAVLKLADTVTERAKLIGAANTLTFREGGLLEADNTDGYGFIENVKNGAPNWQPASGSVLVLGAGGAARAILVALLEAGAPEIILANRTREKAEGLRQEFGRRIMVRDWDDLDRSLAAAHTIVNTTSLGMKGQPEMQLPLHHLRPGQVVTDIVYAPLETKLLKQARDAGCVAVDGLGMLLHQAVPGFERWFGRRPEVDDGLRAAVLA